MIGFSVDPNALSMRYVYNIYRDNLMNDLFGKLQ